MAKKIKDVDVEEAVEEVVEVKDTDNATFLARLAEKGM